MIKKLRKFFVLFTTLILTMAAIPVQPIIAFAQNNGIQTEDQVLKELLASLKSADLKNKADRKIVTQEAVTSKGVLVYQLHVKNDGVILFTRLLETPQGQNQDVYEVLLTRVDQDNVIIKLVNTLNDADYISFKVAAPETTVEETNRESWATTNKWIDYSRGDSFAGGSVGLGDLLVGAFYGLVDIVSLNNLILWSVPTTPNVQTQPKAQPKRATSWDITDALDVTKQQAELAKRKQQAIPARVTVPRLVSAPTVSTVGTAVGDLYRVVSGDTLYRISRRYSTTVEELKRLNGLTGDTIYAGQSLRVPSRNSVAVSAPTVSTVGTAVGDLYRVVSGDTLYRISRRYSTTVEELKRLNGLTGDTIYAGQSLRVPSRDSVAVSAPTVSTVGTAVGDLYRVVSGDTLYRISRRYSTTVEELKRLNGLTGDTIYAGQSLRVPSRSTTAVAEPVPSIVNRPNGGNTYTVTAGDTLYRISRLFNVSVEDLQTWNNLSGTLIYVGQELTVSRVADKAKEEAKVEAIAKVETATDTECPVDPSDFKFIPVKSITQFPAHVQEAYRKYQAIRWAGAFDGLVKGNKAAEQWHNKKKDLPTHIACAEILYYEYDLHPAIPTGKTNRYYRGLERFVKGADGSLYYTADHYITFTKILEGANS